MWSLCFFGSDDVIIHINILPPMVQTQGRDSIAAKLVANVIKVVGADRVLACDLHSGQSQGYFDIPVNHIHGQVIRHNL